MKKSVKALLLVLCAVVFAAAGVFGTLAYFNSTTEEAENTFAIGNVEIDLDEAKVDQYGKPVDPAERVLNNEYTLVPGCNYTKDPIIYVTKGSEPAYVYVRVQNGIAAIEKNDNNTIADQMTANGWDLVDGYTDLWVKVDAEGNYEKVSAKFADADVKLSVFEEFTINPDLEYDDLSPEYASAKVLVKAFAIQTEGGVDKDIADAAAVGKIGGTPVSVNP